MKILILAQIPPPFHGQAIMQKYLVDAKWDWCEKIHIPLNYSKSISEVGRFKFSKLFQLFIVVFKVWNERLKGKIDLIYYPPAGPHRIPLYRDIITLLLIKNSTNNIVMHFHAGASDILFKKLTIFEKLLTKLSFGPMLYSIVLLEKLKIDIAHLNFKKNYVIPNGINDIYDNNFIKLKFPLPIKILSVGIISRAKGIFEIISAARLLKDKGYSFQWHIIGEYSSNDLKNEVDKFINNNNLNSVIIFEGKKSGLAKWVYYYNSHIFNFPTYELEAMPLVLLEAMMMSLPIVTTNWRGIPELVKDGENGFLVPIKNTELLAEKLEILINNKELREKMGKRGREIFLENYTLDKHLKNMENVFKEILGIGH